MSTLHLISGYNLIIDATDGQQTIANATNLFTGDLDSNFARWGTNEPSSATAKTPVAVYDMGKDATLQQMFSSLSSEYEALCLTQSQIVEFVRQHRDCLRKYGYGTFFLFLSNEELFVAKVYLHGINYLGATLYRFHDDCVWSAIHQHRLIVPRM